MLHTYIDIIVTKDGTLNNSATITVAFDGKTCTYTDILIINLQKFDNSDLYVAT